MKDISKIIFSGLILCCFLCCQSHKKMAPEKFKLFFQDDSNGLLKIKTIKGICYELQFIPNAWMALQAKPDLKKCSDSLLNEYSNAIYFKFDIYPIESGHNVIELLSSDENSYYRFVHYFSYEFSKDIKMIQDNGTIVAPLYCLNEKNYNINNKLTFTLAFPNHRLSKDFKVIISPEPLNAGKLLFAYRKIDIDRIPQLSI